MPELNGSKLIAMFPKQKPEQIVEPNLKRYVEDRLKQLEMTYEELVEQMNEDRVLVTRRINAPEYFKVNEIVAFAKALQIKDWYAELVINFGVGIKGCLVYEFDQLLHTDGHQLGRIQVAA